MKIVLSWLIFCLIFGKAFGELDFSEVCQKFIYLSKHKKCPGIEDKRLLFTLGTWNVITLPYDPLNTHGKGQHMIYKEVTDPAVREGALKSIEIQKMFKSDKVFAPVAWAEKDGFIAMIAPEVTFSIKYPNVFNNKEITYDPNRSACLRYADVLSGMQQKDYVMLELIADNVFHFIDVDSNDDKSVIWNFEKVVKKGDPVTEKDDFRSWDPSRFDPASKPKTFDFSDAMYSFGVINYQYMHKKSFPYTGDTKDAYGQATLKGDYVIKAYTTLEMAYLVSLMLRYDRQKRITLKDYETLVVVLPLDPKIDDLVELKLNSKSNFPAEAVKKLDPMFVQEINKLKAANPDFDPMFALDSTQSPFYVNYAYVAGGGVLVLFVIGLLVWLCAGKKSGESEQGMKDQLAEETRNKDEEQQVGQNQTAGH